MTIKAKAKMSLFPDVFAYSDVIEVKNGRNHIGYINYDVFKEIIKLKYPSYVEEKNDYGTKDIKEILEKDVLEKRSVTLTKLFEVSKHIGVPVPFFLLSKFSLFKGYLDKRAKSLGLPKFNKNMYGGVRESMNTNQQKFILVKIAEEIGIKQSYYSKIGEPEKQQISLQNNNLDIKQCAEKIRVFYGIDIRHIRKLSKMSEIRKYLIEKLSKRDVFVSLGTDMNGIMPVQTGDKVIGAFWLKNQHESHRPWIFVDTKDDIDKHKNPIGRQNYGIILMLVFILFKHNNYHFNKQDPLTNSSEQFYYEVAAEILLPEEEVKNINDYGYKYIKKNYVKYGVTPTFLAKRFFDVGVIDESEYEVLKETIQRDMPISKGRNKKGDVPSWTKAQLNFTNSKYVSEIINNQHKFNNNWKIISRAIFGSTSGGKRKYKKRIQDICRI